MSILLTACQPAAASSLVGLADRPIRAVATTGMVGDVVKNVGGERVEVVTLMGPGIDPHLYKASEGDVIHLGEADVIFYSGLHLEAGMSRVLERISDQRNVKAVTDGIDRTLLQTPPQFKGNYDPHVWFDVGMWMESVDAVRDTLTEMDPAHAALYQDNAEQYAAQLQELDAYIRQQVQRLPEERRVLITAHDAFSYFGRAYGFQVRGLQGISTASEASTLDMQELAIFIVEKRIPAIFVESSVPKRTVEAVQAAVRARGYDVKLGGELYSDAMGTAGTPDGTYLGMLRHNIDTIVSALLGE